MNTDSHTKLPVKIHNNEELEELLSRPTAGVQETFNEVEGDLLVLGAGGKMGPTLCKMAKRAFQGLGKSNHVIAVSRFSSADSQDELEKAGIQTIVADLLDRSSLSSLPDVPNVIYMTGRKFGSTGAEWYTWAMNVYLPGMVAERFHSSRIVAFSTGNVYPLTPVYKGGSVETDVPDPVGEYAQSCLGRERMLQHFSIENKIPAAIIRLNYAVEMRYGILLDVAQKVYTGMLVDLSMGNVNVIWQGDANAYTLQSLSCCETPPLILNVSGPETVSIRWLAERFGELFDKEPQLTGTESETALLNNAAESFRRFGYPSIPLLKIIEWTAHWVKMQGSTLGKPTHYEEREGKF